MQKEIFPIIGNEKELPFYVVGIGIECWQYPVNRTGGYEYPQLFVAREGEGEVTVGGDISKITPGTAFLSPQTAPTNITPPPNRGYWIGCASAELML